MVRIILYLQNICLDVMITLALNQSGQRYHKQKETCFTPTHKKFITSNNSVLNLRNSSTCMNIS